MDVIQLDLSKAFDTVPHNRLVHKLRLYGITDDGLHPFLQIDVSRFNGQSSQSTQESVMGPLLFLCYINDMPENL